MYRCSCCNMNFKTLNGKHHCEAGHLNLTDSQYTQYRYLLDTESMYSRMLSKKSSKFYKQQVRMARKQVLDFQKKYKIVV